jgi:hypothetical protein
LYPDSEASPMKASAIVAIRIGPGHRTIAVPIRRQPRLAVLRLGSSSPKRLPMTSTAGASVSDAASATSTPIAAGIPRLWKYGSRVKYRQATAPAMVSPEPRMTCAVPRYMS